MEAFINRYRNITVLALAIFAQLILLGYQLRNEKDVRLIRLWGVTAVTPVARVVHGGHGAVAGLWNNYIWLRGARRQNEVLRTELDRLKLENQSLRNEVAAASRIEHLAVYQRNIPSETILASVIGTGANPNSRVVFLDRGTGSGVRAGMAVITPDGIVGKVQAVFPGASLVLLLSDSAAAAGVLLEKSRVHGILKGSGLNEARIEYIPNEEKVALGEKVYTSGEDRIFPKGLIVGTVSHTQPGRDFQEITVQPGTRLNRLEEVLVVTKGVHQDLPDSMPRAQAPAALLPLPPADASSDLLTAAPGAMTTPGVLNAAPAAAVSEPRPSGSGTTTTRPQDYVPETDADKLKKRYREIGAAQGHTFGEGTPGSKPPDFNLGWTPPGRKPAVAQPQQKPPSDVQAAGPGPAPVASGPQPKATAPRPKVPAPATPPPQAEP